MFCEAERGRTGRILVTRILMANCLAALVALVSGCSDCDQSLCEEDCEEAFPDDEALRDACYVECADRAEACRRR